MEFIEQEHSLKLVVNTESEKEALWDYYNDGSLHTDESMFEFFEHILANSHFEWLQPEEVGALTDAPLLGYKDENEKVVEVYGFMNYCVQSLLEQLFVHDEVELDRG